VNVASARLDVDDLLKNRGVGRPETHPADLAKTVLLQQYFLSSNRVTDGLVMLFKEKMQIEQMFSYKTIERAYGNPFVIIKLKEVFKMAQEPVSDKEHNFSLDGTGLSTTMKQNWENDCGKGKKMGYEKMIAMVGDTYKVFSAVAFTEKTTDNEYPYLELLLAETASCYERIDIVSGDAVYRSRINCELNIEEEAIPRPYQKQGITLKMRWSAAWAEMLLDFIEDPQEWLRSYHS
jgi:transposase